jgi:MFS family permease
MENVAVNVSQSPGARLWRDRNFNIFWAGQSFDALGDAAALIIIPLLVLEATGSVAQMGLVTAIIGVGNFVSSIASGVVVDRVDRRKVLIFSDFGRAAFYLVVPLVWWLSGPSMLAIYIIAMVTAYLTTFFFIGYTAAVPNVVDRDQITDANGRLQATVAVSYIAGPMIAGFASKYFGSIKAVIIIAASYGVSAVLMLFVRLRKAALVQPKEAAGAGSSRLDSVLSGIRFLLAHPVLRAVTLLLALLSFVTGATINLTIYRLKQDLGQNDDMVGIVFGIASIGAIAAGALAPLLRRKKGFGFSFLGSTILMGLGGIFIGLARGVVVVAILAASYSLALTIRNVSTMSLRQQVTPDHLLGRVSAAFWTMLTVIGPLGTAAASAVAELVGASAVLIATGALSIAVAIVGLFTRASTSHPELTDIEVLPEESKASSAATGI